MTQRVFISDKKCIDLDKAISVEKGAIGVVVTWTNGGTTLFTGNEAQIIWEQYTNPSTGA